MKIKRIVLAFVIILAAVAVIGCGGGAKEGDKVSVNYTGTLQDGTVFDSSYDRGVPLTFTIGDMEVVYGFDHAVRGMKPGEKKTVTLPPEQAYGKRDSNLIMTGSRDELPLGLEVKVGDKLVVNLEGGNMAIATVIELTDDTVTVDANHELAGKTLIFEIELVEIIPAE